MAKQAHCRPPKNKGNTEVCYRTDQEKIITEKKTGFFATSRLIPQIKFRRVLENNIMIQAVRQFDQIKQDNTYGKKANDQINHD